MSRFWNKYRERSFDDMYAGMGGGSSMDNRGGGASHYAEAPLDYEDIYHMGRDFETRHGGDLRCAACSRCN